MISRRSFIAIGGGLAASLYAAGHSRYRSAVEPAAISAAQTRQSAVPRISPAPGPQTPSTPAETAYRQTAGADYSAPISGLHPDEFVLDRVAAIEQSQAPRIDIIATEAQRQSIDAVVARLRRLQNYVGYGNFNIIGWDQSLKVARDHDKVGAFTPAELELIEEVFSTNAQSLGFYGEKVITQLSATILQRDILKVPGTGHFLFKGAAADTYVKIQRDLGDSVLLTSGIRSVVKQFYLYLNKVRKVDGNLSLASYSLAPPGHSYHAIGDFDVGKKGFGLKNFSAEFAQTDEFKRLIDLGYLDIRYTQKNPFGVRYEPWHIKIV